MDRLAQGHHVQVLLLLITWAVAGMALVAAAPLAPGSACLAAQAIQTEIEEELTCQCGCGLTVHNCNHVNCPSAIPLRREIASLIAKGLSRQEILDHFRVKYGEKILSSPTTRGFNLTAWVAPFVALLLAGGFIIRVTRRWRRDEEGRRAEVKTEAGHSQHLRKKMAQELDKFDS